MLNDSHAPLASLQAALGYTFSDLALLKRALTHRSFANEKHSSVAMNNERLEFLGDSVLGMVVSEYLLRQFPHEPEGKLSKTRSFVVNEKTLSRIASKKLNLGAYLLIGKGEENTQGREKASLLADALEATFAAMYLDGGLEKVRDVIIGLLESEIHGVVFEKKQRDYKTELQEVTQGKLGVIPTYHVLSEHGPDHEKTFAIRLMIGQEEFGRGEGTSKKAAEQLAAKQALARLAK
ncbi:ribonuclease III [Chrysiogenes arsenatis]|uniref:ribonuclease III n=1 Tax=Chrysiogenes arsenatis TaxID=309797 RepID=UPI00040D23FE|nr:ribonuclease III [Chrysiogenes arsenatis]